MERRHQGQHEDCFACKLTTIQFSPYATPSRLRPNVAPAPKVNSWEKGIVTDERGLPVRRSNGAVIGVKEWESNRSTNERLLREAKQGVPIR